MTSIGPGKTLRATIAAVAVALLLAGCGHLSDANGDRGAPPLPKSAKIAVVPFENFTSQQNAGMVAAGLTLSELSGRGLFNLVPFDAGRRELEKSGLRETDRLGDARVGAIGQDLGADAVLIGSVSEYGYQYGLREEPSVTITLRLVRSSDGAVIWTHSAAQVGRGMFSRESVSMVALSVIRQLVDALGT